MHILCQNESIFMPINDKLQTLNNSTGAIFKALGDAFVAE